MKKDVIVKLSQSFEGAVHVEEGTEYWMARDLQTLFEYAEWENFANVIEKAKVACEKSKHLKNNHFRDITKMINLGNGAQREIPDCKLTRYACYLVAQNGDPRKEPIAFAQTYFALQTRKQELLEKHIATVERLQARQKLRQTEKELSSTLYEHGVDDQGFGRIRSKGDQALFGGKTTGEMKNKLGIPETRPLADFLPTITIKAKDFAGEITHFNVKKEDLQGENQITEEHVKNNQGVRQVLMQRNIYPEELPAEEDIKKLEKQIKKQGEMLIEHPNALPSVEMNKTNSASRFCQFQEVPTMKQSILNRPEIKVVGIKVRTNNRAELDPHKGKLLPCVQKYFHQNLAAQIPNRIHPGTTYCTFFEYESDHTGDYTYLIGEAVSSFTHVPNDFQTLLIPAQTYVKFTNGPGCMPDVVRKPWQQIWEMSPKELGGKRSYRADFEIYDERASDHQKIILDIYIGIDSKK